MSDSLRRRIMMGQGGGNPFADMYLTFKVLQSCSFSVSNIPGNSRYYYSLNGGSTWTALASGASTPNIAAGNEVCWKASGLTPTTDYGIGTFSSTGNFEVYGNVQSLRDGDNFATSKAVSAYQYTSLFQGCANLISAENLVLAATTLADSCYKNMLRSCSNMTKAPKLPARNIAARCYQGMMGYTAITEAPALPAMTLFTQCYQGLFDGCSELIKAPDLLAPTGVSSCYDYMFQYDSKLNYIKCLLTNISTSVQFTDSWVQGVAGSGTFVKASSAYWLKSYSHVPEGWTIVNA